MFKNPNLLAILTIVVCTFNANGQYSRAPSNPYGQSTGGGTISPYSSYRNYNGNNNNATVIVVTPLYPFGPPVMTVSTPNYQFVAPYNPFAPLFISPSVYSSSNSTNPVSRGGDKTTGSTGSYSSYGTSRWASPNSAYIPPVAVEGPRKAFDRWAQQIDQQPDGRRNNDDINRALTAPTPAEIASGAAQNTVLEALKPFAAKLKEMQAVVLDDEAIKSVQFTRGMANEGILRKEGKLEWPALLLNLTPKEFAAKIRQEIDTRFRDAYNEVRDGGVASEENLKQLKQRIDQLEGLASDSSQTLTFTQTVEVKRYLKSLEDAAAFLKKPDASDWLPGKPAQAKTLQELVLAMNEKGMRFAPALTGREGDYAQLHRLLAELFQQIRGGGDGLRK